MKKTAIEKQAAAAMQRLNSAESDERYYTNDIDHHDREASRIRKLRQKARARKDRAKAAMQRLAIQHAQATN